MIELLVYGPAEVKKALGLRTLASARALWSRPDFPALPREDPKDMKVDREDLAAWWKAERDRMRALEKGSSKNDEEKRQDEAAAATARHEIPGPGSIDLSRIVLR